MPSINPRLIEPNGDDDPVQIVIEDGKVVVRGSISADTMRDLISDSVSKSERIQYVRDRITSLTNLVLNQYRTTRIIQIEITLNHLEALEANQHA
jgi:hypothetical protein